MHVRITEKIDSRFKINITKGLTVDIIMVIITIQFSHEELRRKVADKLLCPSVNNTLDP